MRTTLRRVVSLLLIISLLSGFAILAFAANEDVTLTLYRENGTIMDGSESILVGDKITVKMHVNTSVSAFAASFRVWYDKDAFEYNSGAYTDAVTQIFSSDYRIATPSSINNATEEEQAMLDSGLRPVNLVLAAGSNDKTTPVGEWVSLVFTAKAAGTAQFQPQIRSFDSVAAGEGVNAAADWTVSGASVTVTEPTVAVTGITLNQTELTLTAGGATATLTATVVPESATDKTVTWESSNTAVATVANGVVTSVGAGEAIITASCGGFSASCTVTVTSIAVTGISLSETGLSLIAGGDPVTLVATVSPENATDKTVVWSSSDPSVATVSSGVVTPIAEGSTIITAAAGEFTATSLVTVISNEQRNYSVAMPADTTVDMGNTVDISVSINSSDKESYNAFDITFSYDPEHLTLLTESNDELTLEASDGIIRVFRYGANKSVGDAIILQFRAIAPGETTVSCTKAYVDESANAPTENVAEASIVDSTTVINAQVYYKVTLAEGLTSTTDLEHVLAGSSVNFSVADYSQYYIYTVTALKGEDTVAVTDNGDGSYTIDNISGNVAVSFTKEGIQSSVEITGDDVSGETGDTAATYGTDYTFTVTEEEGYTYEITVTIGGVAYTGELVPDANGVYTIPGTVLTGALIVTVTKTPIQDLTVYTVTFEGSGAADVPNKPTGGTKGESLTFAVNEEAGYKYTVTYSVDGGNDVTLTGTDGSYTISGTVTADVNNYIIITVSKVKTYNLTFEKDGDVGSKGQVGKLTTYQYGPDNTYTVTEGEDFTFKLTQHNAFAFTVTATVNGVPTIIPTSTTPTAAQLRSVSVAHTYTIPGELITGDVTVTVKWRVDPAKFNILIEKLVDFDGGSIFFVGVQTKGATNNNFRVDEFDDVAMLNGKNVYLDEFKNRFNGDENKNLTVILVIAGPGETITEEDVCARCSYGNNTGTLSVSTDVNQSGMTDINDAQLIYDIYNGHYSDFEIVSMKKFFNADVNHDISIDVTDTAAVVNAIN